MNTYAKTYQNEIKHQEKTYVNAFFLLFEYISKTVVFAWQELAFTLNVQISL